MAAAASLRKLLTHSVDYAGMFPPCGLALEPALENQARYVRSSDAWMLGAFILSVGQFDLARPLLVQFDPQHPLALSALGPKTADAATFREALEDTMAAIQSLAAHNVDLVSISQLEMPLPPAFDAGLLRDAWEIVGNLKAFWEAPVDTAQRTDCSPRRA